jgi:hypothetical protein
VIGDEFAYGRRRLRIQIRKPLAVHAHARPEIAAGVSNEALRHRDVPLRFGGVSIRQGGEMRDKTHMVGGLCTCDQLPHLEVVEHGCRLVLRRDSPCEDQERGGSYC